MEKDCDFGFRDELVDELAENHRRLIASLVEEDAEALGYRQLLAPGLLQQGISKVRQSQAAFVILADIM